GSCVPETMLTLGPGTGAGNWPKQIAASPERVIVSTIARFALIQLSKAVSYGSTAASSRTCKFLPGVRDIGGGKSSGFFFCAWLDFRRRPPLRIAHLSLR